MNGPFRLAALGAVLALAAPARGDDEVEAAAPAAPAEVAWVADFDEGVEQARLQLKDLLVDFTGSDWCGWCVRLHREVFGQEEFLQAAGKEYVLVSLDFPRAPEVKAKVPNPDRNAELAKKYGVRGYPTVLLMTAEGEVYGQTGYQEGGAANYLRHVEGLRAEGLPALKESKALAAKIKAARGADLAAACDRAVAALAALPEGSGLAVVRVLPVKAAIAADPDNKAGIAAKAARAMLKAGAADEAVLACGAKFDPKNEQGLLEQVVLARGTAIGGLEEAKAFVKECESLFALGDLKDRKAAKQLAAGCMFIHHQHLKDAGQAKSWAKRVQAMGFDLGEEKLQALVEKILGAEAPQPGK